MRFHKPSISVSQTVNGISRRVTVSEREERGMTSMFCCKHPFTWCILLCGAASGRLWLKIWEQRNEKTLFVGTFSIWKLAAVKTATGLNLKGRLCCRMTTLIECCALQYGAFVLACVLLILQYESLCIASGQPRCWEATVMRLLCRDAPGPGQSERLTKTHYICL